MLEWVSWDERKSGIRVRGCGRKNFGERDGNAKFSFGCVDFEVS